jgi:hypothetical protein
MYPVGGLYDGIPLKDITISELRYNMKVNFEANFCKSPFGCQAEP